MNDTIANETLIRDLFEKRLSTDLIKRVLADPSIVETNGEIRSMTVMFTDMINFAPLVDSMKPATLVAYMNDFLTEMTRTVIDCGGFMDKIIGDALLALWGTAANPEDHSVRACRAALEMQRGVKRVSAKWTSRGERATEIAIGIHSGEAIIANFGPPEFRHYTPMGATINTGARLESYCRDFGVSIAIGAPTVELAGEHIVVREVGSFTPRGQGELKVYELVAMADEPLNDATKRMLEAYDHGMRALEARDVKQAQRHFVNALDVAEGDDFPSLRRLSECAKLSNPATRHPTTPLP